MIYLVAYSLLFGSATTSIILLLYWLSNDSEGGDNK